MLCSVKRTIVLHFEHEHEHENEDEKEKCISDGLLR
jgi:hypothetical protein